MCIRDRTIEDKIVLSVDRQGLEEGVTVIIEETDDPDDASSEETNIAVEIS